MGKKTWGWRRGCLTSFSSSPLPTDESLGPAAGGIPAVTPTFFLLGLYNNTCISSCIIDA